MRSRVAAAKVRWSSSLSVSPAEVGAGALLDPVAPQVDDLLAAGRRLEAGQALADHERDGVLERRVGAVGDLLVVAAVVAVLEHGRDVVAAARHAVGADRLDAGLLGRVEDAARVGAFRHPLAVDARVVAGLTQREAVGMAARDGDVPLAHPARRLGQAHPVAGHARACRPRR